MRFIVSIGLTTHGRTMENRTVDSASVRGLFARSTDIENTYYSLRTFYRMVRDIQPIKATFSLSFCG